MILPQDSVTITTAEGVLVLVGTLKIEPRVEAIVAARASRPLPSFSGSVSFHWNELPQLASFLVSPHVVELARNARAWTCTPLRQAGRVMRWRSRGTR